MPNKWTYQMPIYVTRPYGADNEQGQIALSIWMVLVALLLVYANIVFWSIIGLVTAMRVLF